MVTYQRTKVLNFKKFGYYAIFEALGGGHPLNYFVLKLHRSVMDGDYDFENFDINYGVIRNSDLWKSIEFDMNAGNLELFPGKIQAVNYMLNDIWKNIHKEDNGDIEELEKEFFLEVSKHITL